MGRWANAAGGARRGAAAAPHTASAERRGLAAGRPPDVHRRPAAGRPHMAAMAAARQCHAFACPGLQRVHWRAYERAQATASARPDAAAAAGAGADADVGAHGGGDRDEMAYPSAVEAMLAAGEALSASAAARGEHVVVDVGREPGVDAGGARVGVFAAAPGADGPRSPSPATSDMMRAHGLEEAASGILEVDDPAASRDPAMGPLLRALAASVTREMRASGYARFGSAFVRRARCGAGAAAGGDGDGAHPPGGVPQLPPSLGFDIRLRLAGGVLACVCRAGRVAVAASGGSDDSAGPGRPASAAAGGACAPSPAAVGDRVLLSPGGQPGVVRAVWPAGELALRRAEEARRAGQRHAQAGPDPGGRGDHLEVEVGRGAGAVRVLCAAEDAVVVRGARAGAQLGQLEAGAGVAQERVAGERKRGRGDEVHGGGHEGMLVKRPAAGTATASPRDVQRCGEGGCEEGAPSTGSPPLPPPRTPGTPGCHDEASLATAAEPGSPASSSLPPDFEYPPWLFAGAPSQAQAQARARARARAPSGQGAYAYSAQPPPLGPSQESEEPAKRIEADAAAARLPDAGYTIAGRVREPLPERENAGGGEGARANGVGGSAPCRLEAEAVLAKSAPERDALLRQARERVAAPPGKGSSPSPQAPQQVGPDAALGASAASDLELPSSAVLRLLSYQAMVPLSGEGWPLGGAPRALAPPPWVVGSGPSSASNSAGPPLPRHQQGQAQPQHHSAPTQPTSQPLHQTASQQHAAPGQQLEHARAPAGVLDPDPSGDGLCVSQDSAAAAAVRWLAAGPLAHALGAGSDALKPLHVVSVSDMRQPLPLAGGVRLWRCPHACMRAAYQGDWVEVGLTKIGLWEAVPLEPYDGRKDVGYACVSAGDAGTAANLRAYAADVAAMYACCAFGSCTSLDAGASSTEGSDAADRDASRCAGAVDADPVGALAESARAARAALDAPPAVLPEVPSRRAVGAVFVSLPEGAHRAQALRAALEELRPTSADATAPAIIVVPRAIDGPAGGPVGACRGPGAGARSREGGERRHRQTSVDAGANQRAPTAWVGAPLSCRTSAPSARRAAMTLYARARRAPLSGKLVSADTPLRFEAPWVCAGDTGELDHILCCVTRTRRRRDLVAVIGHANGRSLEPVLRHKGDGDARAEAVLVLSRCAALRRRRGSGFDQVAVCFLGAGEEAEWGEDEGDGAEGSFGAVRAEEVCVWEEEICKFNRMHVEERLRSTHRFAYLVALSTGMAPWQLLHKQREAGGPGGAPSSMAAPGGLAPVAASSATPASATAGASAADATDECVVIASEEEAHVFVAGAPGALRVGAVSACADEASQAAFGGIVQAVAAAASAAWRAEAAAGGGGEGVAGARFAAVPLAASAAARLAAAMERLYAR